jgi:hypothetical protein
MNKISTERPNRTGFSTPTVLSNDMGAVRENPATKSLPANITDTTDYSSLALPAEVTWLTGVDGASHRAELASPLLLDRDLFLSAPIRTPHRYPRQKNIQGLYYFSSTGHHVWHESQLESMVMRWLDMRSDVVAISAQPMLIRFADGTAHTPDLLTMHADHRQVVYDVKPRKFAPKFEQQFAKTRAFCDHVGFGYEVHHELPRQVEVNLSWLSGFKHPGYHPGQEAAQRLHDALDAPLRLRAAATALGQSSRAHGRSALFHLVWTGAVTFDLTLAISDRTLIERNIEGPP